MEDRLAQLPLSLPQPRRLSLGRLLSSCSSISSDITTTPCPLCLDTMTPIDHQHPLLCPTRHCHYNFCSSCIESLISSSKDDYEMASDGNAHVKVFLNCPNCRADLSHTIRDVLLLRKVDTVTWLITTQKSANGSSADSDTTAAAARPPVSLTPSQERTLAAMQELDVQETIQKARDVEESFWRQYSTKYGSTAAATSPKSSHTRRPSLSRWEASIQELTLSSTEMTTTFEEHENDDDEWGVEADLISGVHNSIHLPRGQEVYSKNSTNQAASGGPKQKKTIDPTILQGLEFTMTHAEKLQVTQWMTSGNVNYLASAARLFEELELYARQGVSPAKRQARLRHGSVYQIVEETRKFHEEKKDNQESAGETATAAAATAKARLVLSRGAGPQARRNHGQQILAERRQLEKAIQEQTHLLERFPLPVRMPKCVKLDFSKGNNNNVDIHTLARRFPLVFCNDTWDGTVLDAYSKLTITGRPPNCTVTKKKTPQHSGVYHVLSLGQYTQHYGPVEMTLEHPPQRVLVASVQGEAGRKGIIKGDVITHVDGEEFHGTVGDLLELLHTKATTTASQQQQQSKVEIIFNAEPSIAEALRRRAMVLG